MAEGAFTLRIVTPEARLAELAAQSVVVRSSDGFFTVLDGHTTTVSDVVPGEVRVTPAEGSPFRLAVHGGYVQVVTGTVEATGERATHVTLLAGVAERAEDIDVARAQSARERAEEEIASLRGSGAAAGGESDDASSGSVALAEAEAALRRAEVRLEVAHVKDTAL